MVGQPSQTREKTRLPVNRDLQHLRVNQSTETLNDDGFTQADRHLCEYTVRSAPLGVYNAQFIIFPKRATVDDGSCQRGKLPACRHSHPVGVFHTFKRTGERGDETFLDAPERKSSLEKGRREKRWGAAKAGLPFPAGRKNPECGKRAHRNSHGRRTGRTTVPLADFLLNGSATPMRYPGRKLRTTALSPPSPRFSPTRWHSSAPPGSAADRVAGAEQSRGTTSCIRQERCLTTRRAASSRENTTAPDDLSTLPTRSELGGLQGRTHVTGTAV